MALIKKPFGFGAGGGRTAAGDVSQTNLIFHFRADQGITTATGVSAWTDIVSGSTQLAQSTTANQPAYDSSATVGTLADAGKMTFDGVNDSLYSADVKKTGQPIHIFTVFNPLEWVNNQHIFAGVAGSFIFTSRPSDPAYEIQAEVGGIGNTDFADDEWALGITLFNGSSSSVAKNDGSPVTGNAGTGNMNGGFVLGGNAALPPVTQWGNYELGEILIYDAAITGSALTDIKSYINGQYELY